MLRLTLKGLWAHKLRFVLTGLAVILGVAFMSGTMILTDTMGRTFDNVLADSNEGIDAIVRRQAAIEGDFTEVRERVEETTLARVLEVDGVDAAAGSIQGFAQLVSEEGEVATNDLGATFGTNWIDDERLNPFQLADGRAPAAAGEAIVDRATVSDQGWAIGDTFTALSKNGPVELTLVGEATFGDVEGIPGSTMIATELGTAQEHFGEPGAFDSIVVARTSEVSADELTVLLRSALADDRIEVLTGESDTAEKQADLREDLRFFNTFLLAFAYISLFVGMFIIYNTFSIVIAQRTRDLAMLRAIGAGRGQVLRSVLAEAVAVGLVACGAGLALGIGMSFGLRELLAKVGLDIPSGPTVITAATIITSVIVGVVVTVASAVAPALRASRVAPIAALRDVAIDRSHLSVKRVLAGLAITAGGVVATAAGIAGDGEGALQLLALGAVTTVLGVFVLGPVLARPVLRVLGAPARGVSGTVGHLAQENARRNPKRTSATAAALMVGVALVGFITILASSTTAAVVDQVDKSFRADYVVDSGQWTDGGFSPQLADDLAALPEVELVSPIRVSPVAIGDGTSQIAGLDTSLFDRLYDLEVTRGSLAAVTSGSVAVSSDTAADRHLTVGDTVGITFARTGTVDLTVAAIYDEVIPGAGGTEWVTDLGTYAANVTDQYDRQVFVMATDAADAATSRGAIDEVLGDWPNADLQDQAQFKETITSEINQLLNLIYGLLALAVIIALIGIANTLALSVHERTRELGLLRAVGMARRQIRTLVRWESVMIAVLGTGLGMVLATAGAWAIVQALADEGITRVVVPTTRMAVIVGFAIVAGVVAAVGPARRAARLDILRAVASE
ncbi:MAG: ABC transporter permease [Ilumatobacteraceae bacterium]